MNIRIYINLLLLTLNKIKNAKKPIFYKMYSIFMLI